MDILFLLIPLSVLLALAVMGVLAWAVWSGQFEELEPEAERILLPDGTAPTEQGLIHINTPAAKPLHTASQLQQNRVHP